ncbi:hypothetical protein KAX02_08180 [candidate division WOR-3 bacterium]|nr:hypothetical protein [candidate division WOR-3 bacterium]
MSKEQELIDRYEELLKSEWADRYYEMMDEELEFDKYQSGEDRESFLKAEVDRLVMVIAETGEVGKCAEKCLERMTSDDMAVGSVGILLLLEQAKLDLVHG